MFEFSTGKLFIWWGSMIFFWCMLRCGPAMVPCTPWYYESLAALLLFLSWPKPPLLFG